MICRNCKQRNLPQARFCERCGIPLKEQESPRGHSILFLLTLWTGSLLVVVGNAVAYSPPVTLGGFLLVAFAIVYQLVLLRRCWTRIGPGARISPTRAWSLMLVPIFNLWWIFKAYHGLASAARKLPGRRSSGNPSEMVAAILCIITLLLVIQKAVDYLPTYDVAQLAGLVFLGFGGLFPLLDQLVFGSFDSGYYWGEGWRTLFPLPFLRLVLLSWMVIGWCRFLNGSGSPNFDSGRPPSSDGVEPESPEKKTPDPDTAVKRRRTRIAR